MTGNMPESYRLCEPVELRLLYGVTMLSHCTSSQGTLVAVESVTRHCMDFCVIWKHASAWYFLSKKNERYIVFIYQKIPYTL